MRKTPLALATALVATGLAGQAIAQEEPREESEPQGLYSADDIMDADVYLADNQDEEIGEVEDILLNDDMQVQALVIEGGATFGLGGREVVIDSENFRLETINEDDGEVEHRILVDSSEADLEDLPEYDADWWNEARQQAREAWESTREGAQSAWQRTREGVSNAADNISDSIDNN